MKPNSKKCQWEMTQEEFSLMKMNIVHYQSDFHCAIMVIACAC